MRRALVLLAFVLSGCLALSQHDGLWPCTNDGDCNGGAVCRQLAYRSVCAPSDYCESPADCSGNTFSSQSWSCDSSHCMAPSCSSDATCAPYVCSSASICLSSCTKDAECQPGYTCGARGRCETVSCANDAACPAGALCNGSVCGPRSCTVGAPGQCDGYACTNSGMCATACSDSQKCEPGLVCANGVCQCDLTPGACGGYRCTGHGCATSCVANTDCEAGRLCNAGRCQACTGGAIACASQTSCASVIGCSASEGCVGGTIDCAIYNGASGLCAAIVGCTYDSALGQCQGSTTCASQLLSSCPSQLGCTVGTVCSGTPMACALLSASECTSTLGCTLH